MDIDTVPSHPGRHDRQMLLDVSQPDDVMMEVETASDFPLPNSALAHESVSAPGCPVALSPSAIGPNAVGQLNAPLSHGMLLSGAPGLRPVPEPPVVLVTNSDVAPWPKIKLDQLFIDWLARPESKRWLDTLLEHARSGNTDHLLAAANATCSNTNAVTASANSKTDRASARSLSLNLHAPASPHHSSPQLQGPGSPVSRLFRMHSPFGIPGDSDSGSRSLSPYKRAQSSSLTLDFDLGRAAAGSTAAAESPAVAGENLGTSPDSRAHTAGPSTTTSRAVSGEPTVAVGRKPEDVEKVPDSSTLDIVADGIAGMSSSAPPSDAEMDIVDEMGLSSPIHDGPPVTHKPERQDSDGARDMRIDSATNNTLLKSSCRPAADEASMAFATGATSVASGSSAPDSKEGNQATGREHAKEPDISQERAGTGMEKTAAEISVLTNMDAEKSLPSSTHKPSVLHDGASTLSGDARMIDADDTARSSSHSKRKTLGPFYFPCGPDAVAREKREREAIREAFRAKRTQKNTPGMSRADIAELVVEVVGMPSYFASIVFTRILEAFPDATESQHSQMDVTDASPSAVTADQHVDAVDVANSAMDDFNSAGPAGGSTVFASVANSGDGNTVGNGVAVDSAMVVGGGVGERAAQVGSGRVPSSPGDGVTAASAVATPVHEAGGASTVNNVSGVAPAQPELVTEAQFQAYYDAVCAGRSKNARLFSILRERGAKREYLIPSDFKPLLRALLVCHQGLAFLHATPEFQQRYSETVIERIYFGCTRQHNGRLTLNDIKRSRLLDTLMIVDEEEDINRERKYFSYEHFYVLYCRFWELDTNHDLQIDREDLMRFGSHSLTYRIVDRIFGGYARPLDTPDNPGYMSYTDFIWFCLSEEDKTSDTAIDYWFRCVDMDGDGLITMFDMEFFYKEQLHRMECFGHEPVQVRDVLCQLLDMIKPNVKPPVIRRRDLKKCRLAGNFFNILFNLNKFFSLEARDPLQIRQEHATPELTDWDRFAALEYLRLSAEEEEGEDESWEDVSDAVNPLMAGEAPF